MRELGGILAKRTWMGASVLQSLVLDVGGDGGRGEVGGGAEERGDERDNGKRGGQVKGGRFVYALHRRPGLFSLACPWTRFKLRPTVDPPRSDSEILCAPAINCSPVCHCLATCNALHFWPFIKPAASSERPHLHRTLPNRGIILTH